MKTMVLICLGIIGVASAGSASGTEEVVVSGEADRTSVDLTVYNHDLALVREVRQVTLPKGDFPFEFREVPARINPVTLLVASTGGTEFSVYEQNYEFDLLSPDRILAKYVGREVSWLQEDGSRITGTLLGVNNGPVYQVDGEIRFAVPGQIALPELPDNLRAKPTLVWSANTQKKGDAEIEVSYLTNGISWHADYVLQLNPEGTEAGLQAWVSVDNRSGALYQDAKLLLVAGDVNQARPRHEELVAYSMADNVAAKSSNFTEESLYDYHLYTLDRATTLKDNQIKQISLFEASGLSVERVYRLQGGSHYFRGVGPRTGKSKIDVSYTFANEAENQLGMPLPAGVFRVYGVSQAGSRQLIGEDRIDHTPKDEKVELQVGQAFDIAAERVRSDSKRLADNLYRHTFEITLRNHKDEDVIVEVLESVGGYWEVVEESMKHRKINAT
ncbi:MAG: hypothetical protein ACI8S7_000246, partial [Candidatus Krumholzibacteriia bacterium]